MRKRVVKLCEAIYYFCYSLSGILTSIGVSASNLPNVVRKAREINLEIQGTTSKPQSSGTDDNEGKRQFDHFSAVQQQTPRTYSAYTVLDIVFFFRFPVVDNSSDCCDWRFLPGGLYSMSDQVVSTVSMIIR
jgi:hypothetical protein